MSAVRDEVRLKSFGFNSSFLTDFPCDFEQITSSFASVWQMERAGCSCLTGTLWAWHILGYCGVGGCRSVWRQMLLLLSSSFSTEQPAQAFHRTEWRECVFCHLFTFILFFKLYFLESAILYTIWLFTGVDLESGCSLEDEVMWGCKWASLSLIWALTKVTHFTFSLTSLPLSPVAAPGIEIYWWETLI